MPVPSRPCPVRTVCFPRPLDGLPGVPFHGLMGWGFGDPAALVRRAQVVAAVDVMTGRALLVSGQAALFPVEFGGASAALRVLAVELDLGTPEVDALAALVEAVKGDHDLAWEVASPAGLPEPPRG